MEDSKDGNLGIDASSGSYEESLASLRTANCTCLIRSYGISTDIVRVREIQIDGFALEVSYVSVLPDRTELQRFSKRCRSSSGRYKTLRFIAGKTEFF